VLDRVRLAGDFGPVVSPPASASPDTLGSPHSIGASVGATTAFLLNWT